MKKLTKDSRIMSVDEKGYDGLLTGVSELLEQARHAAARSANAIITATYWEMGRRIVEYEQAGKDRAQYGEELQTLGTSVQSVLGAIRYRMRTFAVKDRRAITCRNVQET